MTELQPGQVEIHGTIYETVALRLKKFWENYPEFSIQTILISADDSKVIVKATIMDEKNHIVATGHAEEFRAYGKINRTSCLENAETSAVGRALAFLGLGGMQIRSADEMASAVEQQDQMDAEKKRKVITATLDCLDEQDAKGIRELWDNLSQEEQMVVWREFNSKQKSAIRALSQKGAKILAEEAEEQAQKDLATAAKAAQ